jgi:mRNA interferase RelE/StbE
MTYTLHYTARAERSLSLLPKEEIIRIRDALDELVAENDPGCHIRRLKGQKSLFSYRIGEYRAILTLDRGRFIIIVIEAGHRSSIYRKY